MQFGQLKRREFITLLGSVAVGWPVPAGAQQLAVIGILLASGAEANEHNLNAFRDGMRQLGYVDGRNIHLEIRFADGYLDRLPALAAELVGLNPRVLVSAPLPAHLAVRRATSVIPIVMATGADPVGFGLVASLAHPDGNVTGLANFAEILASKQLDLLRELTPRLSRVGILINLGNPLHEPQLRETKIATEAAGITLVPAEISSPDRLKSGFEVFTHEQVEALMVPPDTTFFTLRRPIGELATIARLPAIYGYREHVYAGGLMSYGPDPREMFRRAATYVDKILRGAKPADLPVEQPTKIELTINLRTAKALGIELPPTLLARADEVIE
jgi:putative tryptophan/tyrosine transport system substrate-binding protein